MITTVRTKGTFSPPRTLTIATGTEVDFWDLQPQIGRPRITRKPTSPLTREFDKVASIQHKGDVGSRKDWRPHGTSFVQIKGGPDDNLWVSVAQAGITADVSVVGCTPTDCTTDYSQGVTDGTAQVRARWESWIALMGGGGDDNVAGGTAVQTSVPDSATSVTLLAANPNRLGFRIHNDSNQPLYVRYGASAATIGNHTVEIQPDGFYSEDAYTGEIRGIWAADSTGSARVTEITP